LKNFCLLDAASPSGNPGASIGKNFNTGSKEHFMSATEVSGDVLVKAGNMGWTPYIEGIDIKVLRTCEVTGTWTVLFLCQPGSAIPRHRHYGPGEYFVVRGRMEYRAGSATTGDYGYEPLDAIHDETRFPEETELYFTNFGPVVFLDESDNVIDILDHTRITELTAAA
jgi:quercetin dioxygenase-like cupin family protein